MNTKKLGKIGQVLAVVFVAFLTLPPLAAAQEAEDEEAARPAGRMRMLAKDLFDITPEQEKQLEEFRKARLAEQKALREEMGKLRDEIQKLKEDPKANEAKIGGLIDQMYKLRAEKAKSAIHHRLEREKIFTPEQLEKMKKYRGAFFGRSRLGERGALGRLAFGRGFRERGKALMRHRGLMLRRQMLRRHLLRDYWW